jgi:hypothetical protein
VAVPDGNQKRSRTADDHDRAADARDFEADARDAAATDRELDTDAVLAAADERDERADDRDFAANRRDMAANLNAFLNNNDDTDLMSDGSGAGGLGTCPAALMTAAVVALRWRIATKSR